MIKKPYSIKYKIAVAGAAQIGHCARNIKKLAEELGREIARQGCILTTGATTGVPHLVAQGCKKAGGISIGFSPAASEISHRKVYKLPVNAFDLIVYTGFDYSGRNLLMTRAADAVIVACGRMGTLNEFTIAFEDKKPVGVLLDSGGTADIIPFLMMGPHRKGAKIIYEENPKRLVSQLIDLINKTKGRR